MSNIEFNNILDNYKLEEENGEFHGHWDPNKIKTKKQLSLEIKKSGFNFEGDNYTLSILSKILKLDFIIFNNESYSIIKIEHNERKVVLLDFIKIGNTGHYKTIGKLNENQNVDTIFNKNDLPEIFDKSHFFTRHIQKLKLNNNNITLNEIIISIEHILGKLTLSDRKLICKILAKCLMN